MLSPYTFIRDRLATRVAILFIITTAFVTATMAADASAACKKYQHRARVESGVFRTDLAYLYIRLRVCYNGKRITKVSNREVEPAFTKNAVNMGWNGIDDTVSEYRRWRGSARGVYYFKVTGTFNQTLGPITQDHVRWASMKIYANGKVKKDRSN